jgi:hypothetical protein
MSASKKVYTLLLEGGYYYVGITKDVLRRFEAHREGTGASWTKLHKPVEIVAVEVAKTPFDEDRVVKTLMHEHGIERVRGGSYVTVDLSASQIRLLRKEITMATGACIICGELGHMAKGCPSKEGKAPCDRCGRVGHDIATCFAKKSKNGEPIETPTDVQSEKPKQVLQCTRCGWGGHEANTCFAKRTKTGILIDKPADDFVVVDMPATEEPDTNTPRPKKAPRPPAVKKEPDVCNVM